MKVAFLYEHPTWTRSLLAAIRARDVEVEAIDVAAFRWRVDQPPPVVDRWINRVNSMPSAGRPEAVVAATGQLLAWLELHAQTVINGSAAHRIGCSKASQGALFAQVGMGTPASLAIIDPAGAPLAAEAIGYPVLTKPNVGGSGVGIQRFDRAEDLVAAVGAGEVDLGIDGTGIVQKVLESADGMVYRIEIVGPEVLYATAQPLSIGGFNYCAVDGVGGGGKGSTVRLFDPTEDVIGHVRVFMAAAQADVGSVEFIIDANTGQPSFFDFNPYSNFIEGYDDELGFNPIERYVDFVLG
ncbi:MAG: hypothetical protein GWP47_06730 [Actinobacteria bacterium]|jgi:hypothetical protein|nr:hypothetical protein [Actinomycetota bacterium]NCG37916.1 hypothetical protein [Actinomycetota bacterium]